MVKPDDVFELQRGDNLRVFGIEDSCIFSSLAVPERLDRIAVIVKPKKGDPYLQLVDSSQVRMVSVRGRTA